MKKILSFMLIFAAIFAVRSILALPALISVELPTMESKKAWHQLKIPTYELVGNMAIAIAEDGQIPSLKLKGYQINILGSYPDLSSYRVVSKRSGKTDVKGSILYENENTAIIRTGAKDIAFLSGDHHGIRPINTKPLGDRFWKGVTTKYVPIKSIPYDPFIQSLVDQVDADSIASYIQRLQDFKTRVVFTDSSYAASQWIFDKYKSYGLITEFDSLYLPTPDGDSAYERNVIGYMPGYLYQTEIIASGHFDSEASSDSLAPGADDNASGTAAAIEVARIFSKQSCPIRIASAAWAAEEKGMVGSYYYAQTADSNDIDIKAVINMDMIGYMNDSVYDCIASGTTWLTDLFTEASRIYSPVMVITSYLGSVSDEGRFIDVGYPALGCFENPWIGGYPYYHSSEDLLDKLTPTLFTEITKTAVATIAILTFCPSEVEDVKVTQTENDTSLLLTWTANNETNVVGYWIWWGDQSGVYTDSTYLAGRLTDSGIINGLEPNSWYYIIIRAVTGLNNLSYLAEEVHCMPVVFTLNQGILIIDETNNWTTGSWPRDAQQDSFYEYMIMGYKFTQYNFDNTDQIPTILNFNSYSTIVWFADDNTNFLSYNVVNDLVNYIEHGGKLWFAGWKPTGDIRNSTLYPADFTIGSILYDDFKISHVELSGSADSFKMAVGLKGYPNINVDTLKFPVTVYGKTMRLIEALTPTGSGDTIYVMDMKNDGSPYEGKACAVRDSGKTVFFGFPVYFMDREDARLAAQRVMAEFGEPNGVAERKPEMTIPSFKLYQNAPNPFSRQTNISYQLPKAGRIKLSVYNIAGQLVKTIVNGEQQAGSYAEKWDGYDNNGRKASNGVYIYCLDNGIDQITSRMLLLK
jgi:hypothetical protein